MFLQHNVNFEVLKASGYPMWSDRWQKSSVDHWSNTWQHVFKITTLSVTELTILLIGYIFLVTNKAKKSWNQLEWMRHRKKGKEMDFTLKEKEREKGEGEYKENKNIPKRNRQTNLWRSSKYESNKEWRAY